MRKPIIAGNWKMNLTVKEAVHLVDGLKKLLKDAKDIEIVVCPTSTSLSAVSKELSKSNIKLGAQNIHYEESGAFTGEISASMIKEAGCEYVIVGHSERRQYFNETDESVNKKVKAAIRNKLTPIVCIGETLDQREAGETEDVVEKQILYGLKGVEEIIKVVVAYEPVWAIGTGRTASPEKAQEVHAFIRKKLAELFGNADEVRILYGGSVNPENIKGLMQQNDIDGALVGGASLKAESFANIVKFKG